MRVHRPRVAAKRDPVVSSIAERAQLTFESSCPSSFPKRRNLTKNPLTKITGSTLTLFLNQVPIYYIPALNLWMTIEVERRRESEGGSGLEDQLQVMLLRSKGIWQYIEIVSYV